MLIYEECGYCQGSGGGPDAALRCPHCNGTGEVRVCGSRDDDFDPPDDPYEGLSERDLDALASKAENAWRGKDG